MERGSPAEALPEATVSGNTSPSGVQKADPNRSPTDRSFRKPPGTRPTAGEELGSWGGRPPLPLLASRTPFLLRVFNTVHGARASPSGHRRPCAQLDTPTEGAPGAQLRRGGPCGPGRSRGTRNHSEYSSWSQPCAECSASGCRVLLQGVRVSRVPGWRGGARTGHQVQTCPGNSLVASGRPASGPRQCCYLEGHVQRVPTSTPGITSSALIVSSAN